MPTYSYRCANCDYAFDQYQAFSEDSLTVCPNCGEPKLRKVFNSIGVTFTGSGFYSNDNRAGGSGNTGSSGGSEKKSGESKSSGSDSASKPSESKKESASAPAAKPSGSPSKE